MPQSDNETGRRTKAAAEARIRRPRWTKPQVEALRRLYRVHSNAEIARVLGRPVASVVFKAHCLGLAKGVRRLREMGRENIAKRWRARRGSRTAAPTGKGRSSSGRR